MKNKSATYENIIKPIIVLTVICLVVSGLLAVTHSVTQPIIDASIQRAADASRIALLPEADSFEKVEYTDDVITEVWKAKNGTGFVLTGSSKGYGGQVPVTVGIDASGTITGISIGENSESAGIGKKVEETSFTDQFKGKTSADGVDAISGASFSSKAVFAVVNAAAAAYQTVKGA